MHFYNACIPAWHNAYTLHDIFLVCAFLQLVFALQSLGVDGTVANTLM